MRAMTSLLNTQSQQNSVIIKLLKRIDDKLGSIGGDTDRITSDFERVVNNTMQR